MQMSTLRLILLLNFGGFCVIVLLTHLLAKGGASRVKLVGWICVVFSTSVFAAPLSIIVSIKFFPYHKYKISFVVRSTNYTTKYYIL